MNTPTAKRTIEQSAFDDMLIKAIDDQNRKALSLALAHGAFRRTNPREMLWC